MMAVLILIAVMALSFDAETQYYEDRHYRLLTTQRPDLFNVCENRWGETFEIDNITIECKGEQHDSRHGSLVNKVIGGN